MKIKINNENAISSEQKSLVYRRQGKVETVISWLTFWFKNTKPVVAVIRLDGIIGKGGQMKSGITIATLNKQIERAFEVEKLAAVCLCINSPGGAPAQAELVAKRIIELSKAKDIPVISFVEDVAASGGYWLACAGDEIYATKSSIIGSIGVISSGFGFHQAIEKIGVERRVYTEGKNKSILDPFLPAKSDDVALLKKLQKNIHEHFVDYVKQRRGRMLTQDDSILFNGEFWTGQIAVDYGLIDGIDDMYSYFKKNIGDDVKFEYIEQKTSFFKKLFNSSKTPEEIADVFIDKAVDKIESKLMENRFNLK